MRSSNRSSLALLLVGTTVLGVAACTAGVGADGTASRASSASAAPAISDAEKARIQAFLDERYTASDVQHSFHTKFGQTVDCIDFFAQPGVKELARRGTPITELPPRAPRHESARANAKPSGMDDVAFDGSLDEEGNARACSDATVPMVRIEPAMIEKAGGLDAYLAGLHKVPVQPATTTAAGANQAPDSAGLAYAHAQTQYSGAGPIYSDIATLSVWDPTVTGGADHSLMQTWTTSSGTQWRPGVDGGAATTCAPNCQQTIEAGWTVDPGLTGSGAPTIFIYSTPDGYQSGCYDSTLSAHQPGGKAGCPAWVSLPGATYAYGQTLTASTAGSTPKMNELSVEVMWGAQPGAQGNVLGWGVWMSVNSPSSRTEIGYYPASDYTGTFQSSASVFQTGAEVDDNTDANTTNNTDTFALPMGSGSLASAGWGYAGYVHDYEVNLNSSAPDHTSFSAPGPTVSQYATWTAPFNELNAYSPAPGVSWQNFFYVGGASSACTSLTCTGCNDEYTPSGHGTVGYTTVETVSAPVNTTAMYQSTGTGWVALPIYNANLGYPPVDKGTYVIGTQSSGVTTSGAPIGSTAEVESCVGSVCAPPWFVTVETCCTPMTTCQAGMCGTQSDGCTGNITCDPCGSGQACVSGMCEDTGAQGACEASGGTWAAGKCIKVPIKCGGKLPACQ